jgi:hypothetical protein
MVWDRLFYMTRNSEFDSVPSLVSKTVWPWREPVGTSAPPSSCRKRAIVQFLVMIVVAGLLSLKYTHAAVTMSCVALFVIVTGLFLPKLFLAVQHVFKVFGHCVGVTLTWLLLVPFFVLVFVPGRLALLLARKDPLSRAFPGEGTTSWQPHRTCADKSRYRKQYK